jgi:hypothetical protein
LALSSNKSSKAGSPACHSLPLFCKSRFVRCSANLIFLFIFLAVNVPARLYSSPPFHSDKRSFQFALKYSTHDMNNFSLTKERFKRHAEGIRSILHTKRYCMYN